MSEKTFHFYGKKLTGKRKKSCRVAISGVVTKDTMRIGIATCSKRDQFVKKLGRAISTGRAISEKAEAILATNSPKEFIKWCVNFCEVEQKKDLPKKGEEVVSAKLEIVV